MRNQLKERIGKPLLIFICITILTFTVSVLFPFFTESFSGYHPVRTNILTPLYDGWLCKNGEIPVSASVPGSYLCENGSLTLERTVHSNELYKKTMIFYNEGQRVRVFADDTLIFLMGDKTGTHFTNCVGYCIVPLPEQHGDYTLTLEFSTLRSDSVTLPEIHIGAGSDIVLSILKSDLSSAVMVSVLFLMGAVLFVAFLYFYKKKIPELSIITLSAFLLMVSLWFVTDMTSMALIPINGEIIGQCSFFLLMLIPLPFLAFTALCTRRPHRAFRILAVLTCLNICGQTILLRCNVLPLFRMLPATHALIFLVVFCGLYFVWRDYRLHPTPLGKLKIAAFLTPEVVICLAVILYWTTHSKVYQILVQIGITLFFLMLLLLAFYTLADRNKESQKKEAQLRAYQTMSMEDPLTHLQNRRSFDIQICELTENSEDYPEAILIFMDLNKLKIVNDAYGHSAGDNFINTAANCIHSVFGTSACYRIGGDEFAVILKRPEKTPAEYYRLLDETISEKNQVLIYPLSIARGHAALHEADGSVHSAISWIIAADKKMYENKMLEKKLSNA